MVKRGASKMAEFVTDGKKLGFTAEKASNVNENDSTNDDDYIANADG